MSKKDKPRPGHDPGELDSDLFDPEVLTEQLAGSGEESALVEITDVLDLHTFRPKDIADVVREYLDAAVEQGLSELRIIHGRGIGVQRETVRKILARDPRVLRFGDAPGDAGGWGATLVWISSKQEPARSGSDSQPAVGRNDGG